MPRSGVGICSLEYRHTDNLSNLVKFSNGCLKDDTNVDFKLYGKGENIANQSKKIMVASTDRLDYIGQNFGSTVRHTGHCKYYVGVLNKKTGKMKVQDVNYFQLNPKIDVDMERDIEEAELSFKEKQEMLVSAFGSKKKKQAMSSRIKLKVSDKAIDSAVNKTISGAVLQMAETQRNNDEDRSLTVLPPMNRSATHEKDVFNLDDFITQDELNSIDDEEIEYVTGATAEDIKELITKKTYSNYLLTHSRRLKASSHDEKAKLIIYVDYLLTLIKLPYSTLKKKNPLPENIPVAIRKKLLDSFTQFSGKERTMPMTLKDKALIHVLVLALFIDNFVVPLDTIQPDLKMDAMKMKKLSRALGLKTESKHDERFLALRLPLNFEMKSRSYKRRTR